MSKCCVICVGRNADRAADRIEAYAKKADFEIVETIFKDTKSVERLKFYPALSSSNEMRAGS